MAKETPQRTLVSGLARIPGLDNPIGRSGQVSPSFIDTFIVVLFTAVSGPTLCKTSITARGDVLSPFPAPSRTSSHCVAFHLRNIMNSYCDTNPCQKQWTVTPYAHVSRTQQHIWQNGKPIMNERPRLDPSAVTVKFQRSSHSELMISGDGQSEVV
ncbi:hypothetical protein ElyMa_001158900 [Elysia marginata]|uniref:FHA domain-containing protein n=1 Tax=Elysia marginata TaxID=1093978 RepID=A0AAV4I075_9GAST|nr:hypothetical protein ElyMa_001158900 [Elysia marginata]